MDIVKCIAPVDALQGIGCCWVVRYSFAETIATVAGAQVVSGSKEESVLVREVYVKSANHVVKSVAFPIGIGKKVSLAIGAAWLIGLHIVLKIILGDGRDAATRNNIAWKWCACHTATLSHARKRIVNRIDGAHTKEGRKIAPTFRCRWHGVGGRSRQCILHAFISKHEEHLVLAIE